MQTTRSIVEIENYSLELKKSLQENPSNEQIKLLSVLEKEAVWAD